MAGKTLTKDDFAQSGDPTKEDTSSKDSIADQIFDANQKFDQDGKPIVEEPEKKETPKEDKVESLPKPSDEFKPKHKTWEETEKARAELERGFTDKSMKLSDAEKELARFKKPPEKPLPTEDEKIAEITDAAIKEIRAIPLEYDSTGKPTKASIDEQERKSAIIWGKAQRSISRLEIDESNKHTQSEREIVTKTYERAQKEGLKTDAELKILGFEFSRTDASLSPEDRIDKAIESTKGIVSSIREGLVKDQEKDKKDKEDLKVLGRGSTRKDTKEEKDTKPVTMSSQLAELNEKRRMTKDDLR